MCLFSPRTTAVHFIFAFYELNSNKVVMVMNDDDGDDREGQLNNNNTNEHQCHLSSFGQCY